MIALTHSCWCGDGILSLIVSLTWKLTTRAPFHKLTLKFTGEDMTAAMSAGAATVTGGVAKASSALFSSLATLKLQAERVGNSISIRRVEAEENQGAHPAPGFTLWWRALIQAWRISSALSCRLKTSMSTAWHGHFAALAMTGLAWPRWMPVSRHICLLRGTLLAPFPPSVTFSISDRQGSACMGNAWPTRILQA